MLFPRTPSWIVRLRLFRQKDRECLVWAETEDDAADQAIRRVERIGIVEEVLAVRKWDIPEMLGETE